MSARMITARVAVAAALLPLVAGCSDDEPDAATKDAPSATPSSTPSSTPSAAPSEEQVVLPAGVLALPEGDDSGALAAGRYRVPLDDTHAFDVDLREGSESHAGGLYISSEEVLLKTEVADDSYGVPEDVCRGGGITPTGPTVDDLVQAIRGQRALVVSRPEPVSLGGATGQHLTISIDPAFDVTGCRDQQVNLPGRYGTNNNMSPAYRGEWWILDTGDQRVVVQALCDPCEAGAAKRIRETVGSIAFTATP